MLSHFPPQRKGFWRTLIFTAFASGLIAWILVVGGVTFCTVSPPPATDALLWHYDDQGDRWKYGGSAQGECVEHFVEPAFLILLTLATIVSIVTFQVMNGRQRIIAAMLFILPGLGIGGLFVFLYWIALGGGFGV